MRRGRLMMLTLLALALPTAALANSVTFTTGLFQHGTVMRQVNGGLTRPNFRVVIVGSVDTFDFSTTNVTPGCNVANVGSCAFSSGTLIVKNTKGTVIFSDTLSKGTILKTDRGATIAATLGANSMMTTGGFMGITISYGNVAPFTNTLVGGTGVAASNVRTVPEPSSLFSLGTGVIGLVGIMSRKLKPLMRIRL